jgi:hypothetical protein
LSRQSDFGAVGEAALGDLNNVVAERFRHRVQRQSAVDESLNEFKPARCTLLVVIDDAKRFSREDSAIGSIN